MKGKFIVISGPGGVGKDTIAKELVNKGIAIYSVSMTTRKKRSNEIDGKDYFFVDINTFENNIKEKWFICDKIGYNLYLIILKKVLM